MTYFEFKTKLPPDVFFYQQLFDYLLNLKSNKIEDSAKILTYNFKNIKLKNSEVNELGKQMLTYV